jgi:hypothetical protein
MCDAIREGQASALVCIRAEGGVILWTENLGAWSGRLIAEQRATITHEKSSAAVLLRRM